MYRRWQVDLLKARLNGGETRMQVLAGPRQTGKTTIASQVIEDLEDQGITCIYASADSVIPLEAGWILERWTEARLRASEADGALLFLGGYPGAATLVGDFSRWRAYILDAIVEPVLTRDILQTTRVDKPALLRRLFMLGCRNASRILSYNRMVGQLQDAGNTTTLAHYLELLEGAGLMAGLQKYSGSEVRSRASSPKLLPLNNGLVMAVLGLSPEEVSRDPAWRGRLAKNAVGCSFYDTLVNRRKGRLDYWRQGDTEVDYVLGKGKYSLAIEVASGPGHNRRGIRAFSAKYPGIPVLLVGGGSLPLEQILSMDPERLIELSGAGRPKP